MKNTKYLAFDIETAKVLPENTHDFKPYRPLGIACAATLVSDMDEVALWRGRGDQMTQEDAIEVVEYLAAKAKRGYTILTWNGTHFDFDILAEESGMLAECRELAVAHIDMMFHILCRLGYGVGLDAAAKGMGLEGKAEGMTGAMAPALWAEGKREEVLKYVAQDVRTTLDVALACEACGALRWISKSGNLRTMALPRGWLTVDQAQELRLPNTSWMTGEPWVRATFTEWMAC